MLPSTDRERPEASIVGHDEAPLGAGRATHERLHRRSRGQPRPLHAARARDVANLSTHPREYVAWGWAVNGFASVVGAVLATILAITYGFHTVLVVALVICLIALLRLRSLLTKPAVAA